MQAAGHAVDEKALQRVVLTERRDQVFLIGSQLLEPVAQVGEPPLLDPLQLLLDCQDAMNFAGRRAHRGQPRASQPINPIMNTRRASPIMK